MEINQEYKKVIISFVLILLSTLGLIFGIGLLATHLGNYFNGEEAWSPMLFMVFIWMAIVGISFKTLIIGIEYLTTEEEPHPLTNKGGENLRSGCVNDVKGDS